MNLKLSSIRIRLLLMILPLMIVSLGTVAGLSYYFANQFLSKSIDETAVSIGADYSNQIKGVIGERVIELEGLASSPVMYFSNDTPQIVKALSDLHKRTGNFDNINGLLPDGSGVRFNGTTTNIADRDYVKAVVSTQKMYIADPMLTRGTGKLGVIIAVPVLEEGKLVKIVTGNVSLQRVTDLLKEVKFKESGYATLIDNSGMIIAHAQIHSIDIESKANTAETLTISAVSEEQSASMQEVAAASQVLSKISCELQDVIVKFKV